MKWAMAVLALPIVFGTAMCTGTAEEETSERASPAPEVERRAAPGRDASSLHSLVDLGRAAHLEGQYDSARALLSSVLDQARDVDDTSVEARALTWLGLGYWRQGVYAEARRLEEEALALKIAEGLTDQLFRSYNALGLIAWDEARLEDAGRLFRASLESAELTGDELGAASAAGNLGLIHTDLGEFEQARAGFERMRSAGEALGDPRREANALTNLGMLDILSGGPRAAIGTLERALVLHRSIRHVVGIENTLGQLGTAYAATGEIGRAHAMYDSALALAREQGLRDAEAQDLEVLAELYTSAGDYQRALRLYGEANVINGELGASDEIGIDLRSEAEIYSGLGDFQLARDKAAEALQIHREIGASFEVMKDLIVLAEVTDELGDPRGAVSHLDEAEAIARALELGPASTEVRLARARRAERLGDPGGVLQLLDGNGAAMNDGAYASEGEAYALRTRALTRLGRFEEAISDGRRALDAVERVRGSFSSAMLRARFVASKARVHEDLTYALLREGRLEEAFNVSDGARAQSLREHLGAVGLEARTRDSTIAMLAEGEELLHRVANLVETAGDPFYGSDEGTRQAVRSRLFAARQSYEELLERVPGQDVRMAGLLGAPIELAAIRAALSTDEVLLEYLVTADRVLIFALTKDDLRVAESNIRSENLANRVRLARARLGGNAGGGDSRLVLEGLYQTLIEPVVRTGMLHGATRLIAVPHGVLSYLPFAALIDPVTQRFLVEDFFLLHLPSAAGLPLLRAPSRVRVATGDRPRVSHVFAPFPEELPGTRSEAESTRKALTGVNVRLGDRATERSLRSALEDGYVVHVATHGVMNSRNPMFSRIALRSGTDGLSDDDGRLEVHELLGMRIQSSLVYLSGCETGLGAAWSTQFSPGEDYATLAQAFLFAGAQNVVATLWPIDDAGASVFSTHFYHELDSLTPLEALAIAQRKMIESDEFPSPFYWASYRLSGSG